jgi:hypothetical protein
MLFIILFMGLLLSVSIWMMLPVKAKVLDVDLPNMNLGILNPKIIGSYDLHLSNFSISGFFKVGNDTVNYRLDIGTADVYYDAGLNNSKIVYLRYTLKYENLTFHASSESFSLSIDYLRFSAKGELTLNLQDDDSMNLVVYEMVPRTEISRSQWVLPPIVKENS